MPNRVPPVERFWPKVNIGFPGECWLWTGTTNGAYGSLHVGSPTDASRRVVHTHRFAWELYNGPIPDGLLVCHRCDVRLCCNPAHLFLGTPLDNTRDMWAKGRANRPEPIRGEKHPKAKLTDDDVRRIRRRRGNGISYRVLAESYGVSPTLIRMVTTRQIRSHVE